MTVFYVLRALVYVLFGFNVQRGNRGWQIEPVPVNFVVGQWLQSLVYAFFFVIGGVERMVLYHCFYQTYCKVVLRRLHRWDTGFLVLKVKETLEDWDARAPNLLHEFDDRSDLETAARERVRAMKQLVFMMLVNRSGGFINIPQYPDLPYELLIQDTAMWNFVQACVFRYQLHHLPYASGELTESGNQGTLNDMREMIESL